MTEFKDVALKPGGAGGPAGDRQSPGRKGKGRTAHGWRVLLISCLLCTAVHHDQTKAIVEEGQGEYRRSRFHTKNIDHNGISESIDSIEDGKAENKVEELRKKEKKKQSQEKMQGKAWYILLFRKKAAPTTTDQWTVMNKKDRLRQRQENLTKAEACLEAFFQRQEKERNRLIVSNLIQRSQKVVEANKVWSSLPMRADDVIRSVTFREPSPCNVPPLKAGLFGQRDAEWRRALDEVRKTQMEKTLEKRMAEKTSQSTASIDWRRDLTTLFIGCTVFLFAWFCANAF
ncbi:uncharacterized protein LOC121700072 [Alosa sapidissima]|uniref:uncharacterized protein LOC121700072 n=1 Tax=Alosa sapidissima TaxID=34773 RepID=UPI001C08A5E1|nr:uncharacterized protein LOC121700072 [Alosa sapidissima]